MKILVIGSNGQIGKHLVDQLQNSKEHTVRAMVRKEEQVEELKKSGIEAVLGDLEGHTEEITKVAEGCDAVIFTAASGSHTDPDQTILIDLDGAIKSVEAAKQIGAKRFVMIRALHRNKRENWPVTLAHYSVAKHYADRFLQASDLNYTILRPGGLLNEPGKGKMKAADSVKRDTIPREDVARMAIATLKNTYRRAFDLVTGGTEIKEVLKTI